MRKLTFFLIILISNITTAQDGSIDTSFDYGSGFSAVVYDIALQSDGKILIGGNFESYKGSLAYKILRLNTNGQNDSTFNTAGYGLTVNNPVNSVIIQNDGKIILGGSFNFYNQTTVAKSIIRLNSNGSKDTSFNNGGSGFGQNNQINAIALQSDGKIITAGSLTSYNGVPLYNIANINTNGSINTTFNIGTGFGGTYNSVFDIVTQSDDKIIAFGPFTTYNGTIQKSIVRINTDGSIDSTFNTGSGFGVGTNTAIVQPDGKIIVGTTNTTYNGYSVKGIIRLNQDGSKDTTFNIGSGFSGTSIDIQSIVLQSDGKIIIGGTFDSYNGTPSKNIVRLFEDGSIDTSFNAGSGFNSMVRTIKLQSDGKILIGGNFTLYNNTVANRIIRLNNPSLEQYILATDEFNINSFKLYPNPTKDILKIQGTSIKNITITNITGKIVVISKINEINISHLQNGIYFVKIENEGGKIFIEKVIKN